MMKSKKIISFILIACFMILPMNTLAREESVTTKAALPPTEVIYPGYGAFNDLLLPTAVVCGGVQEITYTPHLSLYMPTDLRPLGTPLSRRNNFRARLTYDYKHSAPIRTSISKEEIKDLKSKFDGYYSDIDEYVTTEYRKLIKKLMGTSVTVSFDKGDYYWLDPADVPSDCEYAQIFYGFKYRNYDAKIEARYFSIEIPKATSDYVNGKISHPIIYKYVVFYNTTGTYLGSKTINSSLNK